MEDEVLFAEAVEFIADTLDVIDAVAPFDCESGPFVALGTDVLTVVVVRAGNLKSVELDGVGELLEVD